MHEDEIVDTFARMGLVTDSARAQFVTPSDTAQLVYTLVVSNSSTPAATPAAAAPMS